MATAGRLFAATLWGRHPYRLPELGTLDSVASLTHRRVLDHYRRYYGLSGLTIAIVGNVDATRAVARIQALLGDLPGEAIDARAVPAEPPRSEPAEAFAVVPGEDAHVVLGYPGVTVRDPDRFTLAVLSEILSGPAGRLAAAVRAERPLAYGPGASSVTGIDPGYFAVAFACRAQSLDATVRAVRAELARLVERGVTADEVARARRHMVGAHALGLERRSAVAGALAFHEASGAGWQEMGRYAAGLQRVTGADVQRAARKFLDPRREVVAVVKPADETASIAGRGKGEGVRDAAAALRPAGAARVAAP
jgi:zinc protease